MALSTTDRIRSKGEAHLYVAVIKADGVVSAKERHGAAHHAYKSQKRFNMFKGNDPIADTIRGHIKEVLDDPAHSSWSAGRHLDKGIALLKQAKMQGDWHVTLTGSKVEEEVRALAEMDGYVFKESRFVDELLGRLKELS